MSWIIGNGGALRDLFSSSAAEPERQKATASPAALMIDLQSFNGMTPQDATAYADSLGQKLTMLRQNNIPVVWVTADSTGMGNKAWIPEKGAERGARSESDLRAMGFDGAEPTHDNSEIFSEFMQKYGPRQDEPVFRKSFMDAFAEPGDIEHAARDTHKKDLLLQSGAIYEHERDKYTEQFRAIPEEASDAEYRNLFGGDQTVAGYLRNKGVTDTIIMGQVSHYCVLETAVGAASKGFNPAIIADHSLSWVFPEGPVADPEKATLVWRGIRDRKDNPLNAPPDHEGRIREGINEITEKKAQERGLTGEPLQAVRDIKIKDADAAIPDAIKAIQKDAPQASQKPALATSAPGI